MKILVCFIVSGPLYSQEPENKRKLTHPNSIIIELGGHGGYYSLNYERTLLKHSKFYSALQGGLSYSWEFLMPILFTERLTLGNHHLEIGAGLVLGFDQGGPWDFSDNFFTCRGGYRFQKPEGHFVFRAAFTPLFGFDNTSIPLAGLSFGYAF